MNRRLHAAVVSGALAASMLLPVTAAGAADPPSTTIEDFEDSDVAYTLADANGDPIDEFSDGSGDFFTRTDGSNVGSFVDVTGQEGTSWFHGMDLDGEGAAEPLTMTFADIDVASFDSLAIALLVAEDDDASNQDWDDADSVRVEASLDGGALTPVLCIANDGSQFNGAPLVDTDCDGTGDGDEVTDAFTELTGAIDGTGSSLDIVVTWDLDSGDEDLAIDQLRVTTADGGDGDGSAVVEDFEDAEVAYTLADQDGAIDEFSDGAGDFFTRTDGSNIGSFVDVTGQEGTSWFHGMDLDGEGPTPPLTMTFADIDVASFDSLGISLLVAEDDDGGNQDWDSADSVRVEASLDDGPLTPVVCIANDGAGFNGAPLVDTDCDGTGDGDEVTSTFAEVTGALEGTGSSLDIVITWSLDAGDEDLAIDQLRVTTADGGDGDGDGGDPEVPCTEDDLLVSDVQGDGFVSPYEGQTVTVEGTVALVDTDAGGFYLQDLPSNVDGDPATSDGIFVFVGDQAADYEAGQVLQLTDRVDERFEVTQLAFPQVEVCDVDPVVVDPTPISLPLDDLGRESLEGTYVTTAQDLVVTATFSAYRFGELGLTPVEPLTQPTSAFAPEDPAAAELADANAEAFLKFDDKGLFGNSLSPWADGLVAAAGEYLSAGDTFPAGSLVGGMSFSFDEYKFLPVEFPTALDTDEAPEAPELRDGNDVAAFNVLNYFNTFGDNDGLRGAQSQEQFEVQEAKIVAALNTLDAAVTGLIEIENDYGALYDGDEATTAAIVDLVDALNEDAGYDKWDFVAPAESDLVEKSPELTDEPGEAGVTPLGLGTDAIANAIIFQPDRAEVTGDAATFDIDALLEGDSENSRWPLAQSFDVEGPGPDVTVAVNHFKSKGSSCTDTAGPDFDFGDDVETELTGNCNLTREYAAGRLVEWLDSRPTGVDHDRNLVVGDLNSYEEEGPVTVLEDAGYLDNVEAQGDDAFTYKFDGRYGRLDYVMASPKAQKFVTDTEVWQANSRTAFGYLYYNEPQDLSAYGSSDHDPVVVSIGAPGKAKNDKAKGRR